MASDFAQVASLVATQRHSGKVGSKAGQTSKRATTVVSYGKKVYFDFFFSWFELGKLRSRSMKSVQLLCGHSNLNTVDLTRTVSSIVR